MKLLNILKPAVIALSVVGAAMSAPVAAQQAVALEGEVQVERTVIENGTETTFREDPNTVVPGDRLVFTTSYNNQGDQVVEDFVVTNPLPSAVILAETGDFAVSIDGGKSFGALAEMTVADETLGTRPAALADVTHLRWTLDRLEPGQEGTLNYFATVR